MTTKEWIELIGFIVIAFITIKNYLETKRGSNVNLCSEIDKTNESHNKLKDRVLKIEIQFKNHVKELQELKQLVTDNHKDLSIRLDHIHERINSNNDLIKEVLKRIKE